MESVPSRRHARAGQPWLTSARTAALLRHAWLLPLLAVAAFLRLWGISQHHLYGDEAEYSIVARYLSRDPLLLSYPQIDPFSIGPFVSQPPLLLYVSALFMRILGPTDLAALLPAALFGVGTVAVMYFLGCRLGGRFVGLAAAGVLAVLPFHVQLSRRAMLDAGYVFFALLAVYFLVRWAQTRTRGSAIGVGASVAASCLSKLPGVLVLPVALVVLLVAIGVVLAKRARGTATNAEVRETLIQGGLGAAPVVVGGFLYVALLWHLEAISNLWVKLMWQLGRVDTSQATFTEMASVTRDWTWYFTDPKFSFDVLFGRAVFVLGVIGLGVLFVRWLRAPTRRLDLLVAPLAFLAFLAFFLYSDRKEGFYLLPFAAFFALGIAVSGAALRDLLAWAGLKAKIGSRHLAPIAIAGAILLVAVPAMGAANTSYHSFALGDTNEKYLGEGTQEAALYIHAHDPDAAQYGTLLGRFTLYWYNEQPAYHWYVDHSYIESEINTGHLKYVVKDNYIGLTFDDQYIDQLINSHGGKLVAQYDHGWGSVKVFELNAG